jgi:hypothetical protein
MVNANTEDKISVTKGTLKTTSAVNSGQLPNSDFNIWNQDSERYYKPVESLETTIWRTEILLTELLSLFATTPLEVGDSNQAARIRTLWGAILLMVLGYRYMQPQFIVARLILNK